MCTVVWFGLLFSACSASKAPHVGDASAAAADVIADRPTDPRNTFLLPEAMADTRVGEECDWGEKNGRWVDQDLNLTDAGDPWIGKFMYCTSACIVPLCCVY
jgi:hypothetical protein